MNPPARFSVGDDQARPISEATVSAATSNHLQTEDQRQPSRPFTARWSDVRQRQVIRQPENWRLRWRESSAINRRNANATAIADVTTQHTTTRQALAVGHQRIPAQSDSNVRPIRFNEPIRLVSQDVPADPFNDPFGDRDLPMTAARASDPPPLDEPLQSPPTPEGGRISPPAAPTAPSRPPATPSEFVPPPMPIRTTPLSDDSAPVPPETVLSPHDRYQRRDCASDGQECDAHRKRVRESPLSEISLNITPQMTVTKPDRDYDSERLDIMRLVQPRQWRNDDGETLAEGRLTDFRHGRVEIQTEDGLKKVPFADLCDDDMCFVTAWWSIPSECSLGNDPVIDRDWVASTMTWKASSLCHKPLYFEDVNLERYGHSAGPLVQPVLSGAHFFMNVAALPYNVGINPPTECRYPLGYYRPGDCAPWLVRPVPLSIRGGLTAAATYVGGTFIIP